MSAKHDLGTKLVIAGFALPAVGIWVGHAVMKRFFDSGPPPNQGAMFVGAMVTLIFIGVAVILLAFGISTLAAGDREEKEAEKHRNKTPPNP